MGLILTWMGVPVSDAIHNNRLEIFSINAAGLDAVAPRCNGSGPRKEIRYRCRCKTSVSYFLSYATCPSCASMVFYCLMETVWFLILAPVPALVPVHVVILVVIPVLILVSAHPVLILVPVFAYVFEIHRKQKLLPSLPRAYPPVQLRRTDIWSRSVRNVDSRIGSGN